MMTAPQMRAARALLGLGQSELAKAAGLSLPTIQRMEASDGHVRCNVESLVRVVETFEQMGVMLIGDDAHGGRGVRFKQAGPSVSSDPGRDGEQAGQ